MRFLSCVLIVIVFAFSVNSTATPTKYKFAYFTLDTDGNALINVIDPNNLSVAAKAIPLSTPSFQYPSQLLVSPTGEWIAIVFESRQQMLLRLINLSSGQIRDVTNKLLSYAGDTTGFRGQTLAVVWSPNGEYLAFNTYQSGILTVNIYSLATRTSLTLQTGASNVHLVAWSHDSAQLAVTTGYCSDPITCHFSLETFNVAANTVESSVDLSNLSVGSYFVSATLCNVAWSPDNQYISFVSACDQISAKTPYEVYLWNVKQGGVQRITDFTTSRSQQKNIAPLDYLVGFYQTVWLDNQTLLISAIFGDSNSNTQNTQTVAYQLASNTTLPLSAKVSEDWMVNPISGALAFRTFSALNSDLSPKNASINIGTFSGSSIHATFTGRSECDLSWEPNGFRLAYSKRDISCLGNIQGFGFVNPSTGAIQEYQVPQNSRIIANWLIPIGWVIAS